MAFVAVAMSGGVDSAVAAALLAREGHRIVGLTLRLWSEEHGPEATRENRCCSLESIQDARRVCDDLDAPHYVLNVEARFKEQIVDSFVSEYVAGHTPNPCVRCNQYIKFDALLSRALALGVDYLATGHYARLEQPEGGPVRLLRAVDRPKDQSYALCRLNQTQLRHSLFELGVGDRPLARWRGAVGGAGHRRARRNEPLAALAQRPEQRRGGRVVRRLGGLPLGHDGPGGRGIGRTRGGEAAIACPFEHLEIAAGTTRAIGGAHRKLIQLPLERARAACGGALRGIASLLGALLHAQDHEPRAGGRDRDEYEERREPAAAASENVAEPEAHEPALPICSVHTRVTVMRF